VNRSAPDGASPEAEFAPFGALLRRHRMAAGLSQERLAELAQISTEAVSALERGVRRAPQRQTLALLVGALKLDADDREAFTLAAVRPSQPRLRTPRAGDSPASLLLSAPSALTSFVGRESDVATLLSRLRSDRLTTIVGPGGVGKSRLALETARQATAFPDGVSIVALGPLLPHAALLSTIAAALAVRDDGSVALEERVTTAIGERRILLILDNCEHVVDELAPVVQGLLLACAALRVLATSREPLRIDGERVYRLQPLSIGHAVDVFIDRAAANGFDAGRTENDLSIAAEICDRLDRMPLAIELAASCSDVLAFEAILTRLRERELLPAAPKRSALPQHRSMQAVVEWSYDRLDANDAVVFRRFAPFLGGCRLDDAQDIIGHEMLSKDDVLYALFRLHEKSLVDADRASVPRFQMLQTIRDFATAQLGPDERSTLLRRFASHYFSLIARQDSLLRSYRQDEALERISAESTNTRVALSHLNSGVDVSRLGLAALGTLSHYWLRAGTLTEGAEIYAAIDFSQFAPSVELAAALSGAAFVELNRQFFPKALAYAVQAREVAHAIGEPWFDIYAAIAEHTIDSASGTFALAEPFEPVYQRAVELGDPWLIGSAACRMAMVVPAGDDAARNGYLEYALTCAQSSGDPFAIQAIRLGLARSTTQRDPQRAMEFVTAVWEELGPSDYVRKAHCVECFAEIAVTLDRLDDAALLVGVGLAMSRQSGAPDSARSWLEELSRTLAPARAPLVTAGAEASGADAGERVASFMRSFARAR
jgi:predicted ATPase/transcriptional regulator with XRE-family HTH domain